MEYRNFFHGSTIHQKFIQYQTKERLSSHYISKIIFTYYDDC